MTPRTIGRAAFGIFMIFSATAAALGLLTGLGITDVVVLSIVGGGMFYATMRLINRPPSP